MLRVLHIKAYIIQFGLHKHAHTYKSLNTHFKLIKPVCLSILSKFKTSILLLLLSVGNHDIDIIQKLYFSSAGSCSIISNNRLLLGDHQIYAKVLDSLFNHFSQVCSLSILYLSPCGKYHAIFLQVGKIGSSSSSSRKNKANSETTQSYI